MAKKEDPKERFAGQAKVSLDADADAPVFSPTAEQEALDETEEEMRQLAAKLEADRVAAEQAKGKVVLTDPPPLPAAPPNMDAYTAALLQGFTILADQLRTQNEALTSLIKSQTEGKPIPFHKITPVTPWNPEGKRDRVKLARTTMLSGYPVNPVLHTEEEIILFNRLKPGRYHNRKWEVVEFQDGTIDVCYPNRTIEQRMEMASLAPNLTVLLTRILDEQEARAKRRGIVEEVGDD